jgi:tRNA-dihydrouridine synthase B
MSRLKPIEIGPIRIEAPVILAPMTGVTDMPFRRIVKRYGAGLTVTEMIASQAAICDTRQSLQKAAWDPIEDRCRCS